MMPSASRKPFPLRRALVALATLASVSAAPPALAEAVAGLRVMLHPNTAPRGTLPAATLAKLERVAGASFTLIGATRTGALELGLAGPIDEVGAARIAKALREDRSVLWAQPIRAQQGAQKVARAPDPRFRQNGNRLMVRLADGVAEDWPALAPRFAALLGTPVAAERKVGNVWLLSIAVARAPSELAALAARLEEDAAVMYADPVRRMIPHVVPNDPLFGTQWSLHDPAAGVNAPAAWSVATGAPSTTVAVIDTGILPHPDLDGRVLPGYDFVTDPASARDGDGRDPDPRDEGDWTADGDCYDGSPAQASFFHGLFVSGLIAANTDNGLGVAGMDWAAKVLPVRTLAKCGGTNADVFEGMLWASGVQIAGVPPNPNPARVINMSLGGFGACSSAVQEAIDDALAQGSVVIVAAGNAADDAMNWAPANCGGVITVGATGNTGDRAGYSNYGHRVDLSAPGGDGDDVSSLILSTHAIGDTVPGDFDYAIAAGTSFSTPLVSGAASLMIARNPLLTPGRVLSILTGTTRDFPIGTQCSAGGVCGSGILDAGAAVASTTPATGALPPNAIPVLEYYDAGSDHYFITADPNEIAHLNLYMPQWQRTGAVFFAYPAAFLAPPGAQPVCRFYAGGLIGSHFFTANAAECAFVQSRWSGVWALENAAAFYIEVPDAAGACREGTIPVYRFFNNRQDANHRHTPDRSVRRAMVNRSWVPEGTNGVAFCSPI